MELIITGRGVSDAVMQKADLVTEMKEIRHYYQKKFCEIIQRLISYYQLTGGISDRYASCRISQE